MPEITLTRDSGYADRLRNYQVLINGKTVGAIANGKTVTFTVEPGTHTIQVCLDWAKTPVITFQATEAGNVFSVRSNLRGWKIMLTIAYMFIPSEWIVLEQTR